MALTLRHDRKVKQKRERELELEQVGERALKFHKGRAAVLAMDKGEQAELNALDVYVQNLQDLGEELDDRFGSIPEFQRSAWWVRSEIDRALERIVKLNIQLTKVKYE